jgi:hypothetical protein
MPAPEQQVHQFETIIGKATVIVEKHPPTYDSAGFERVLVEVGPSGSTANSYTMQSTQMRLGPPPIPRPKPIDDNDEGWDWE